MFLRFNKLWSTYFLRKFYYATRRVTRRAHEPRARTRVCAGEEEGEEVAGGRVPTGLGFSLAALEGGFWGEAAMTWRWWWERDGGGAGWQGRRPRGRREMAIGWGWRWGHRDDARRWTTAIRVGRDEGQRRVTGGAAGATRHRWWKPRAGWGQGRGLRCQRAVLWLGEGRVEEAGADGGWGDVSRRPPVVEGAAEEGRGEEEEDRGGGASRGGRRVAQYRCPISCGSSHTS